MCILKWQLLTTKVVEEQEEFQKFQEKLANTAHKTDYTYMHPASRAYMEVRTSVSLIISLNLLVSQNQLGKKNNFEILKNLRYLKWYTVVDQRLVLELPKYFDISMLFMILMCESLKLNCIIHLINFDMMDI